MARSGSFTRGSVAYGIPLSYVHPQDNKMPPQWDPALDDVSLEMTELQKQEAQDAIDDFNDVLRGEARWY